MREMKGKREERTGVRREDGDRGERIRARKSKRDEGRRQRENKGTTRRTDRETEMNERRRDTERERENKVSSINTREKAARGRGREGEITHLFLISGSAPASSSVFTISVCGEQAAVCSGVLPASSLSTIKV